MKLAIERDRNSGRKGIILARLFAYMVVWAFLLFGCQGDLTTPVTSEETTVTQPTATIPSASQATPLFPALTPGEFQPTPPAEASPGSTETSYPLPVDSAESGSGETTPEIVSPGSTLSPYPLIQETASESPPSPTVSEGPILPQLDPETAATVTAMAYPSLQETPLPAVPTAGIPPTVVSTETMISPGLPSATSQPEAAAGTPISTVTTARVLQPLGTPQPSKGTVTIWHAWSSSETAALMQVIAAFQKNYPDVRFDVFSIPESELLTRYEVDAYRGGGPSLLIGTSDWTSYLLDRQLVEDLLPFVSEAFRDTVYPSALDTGKYKEQLACLPLSLSGALLYRNTQILPSPANTVEEMLSQAEAATRGGKVGAYLERGFSFSFAHLYGLGGRLLDENGLPAIQEMDYRDSLAWVELLTSFTRPGAYAFNDEKDTSIFIQNRAGYLIDGSWNLNLLAASVGAENLVIDPWPALAQGYLSGTVKAECLFVNINTTTSSAEDHLATLRFMGYLMTTPVQEYLAEFGFIPSLESASPRDPLIAQAHAAFARSTAYPAILLSRDGAILTIYQDTLNAALEEIFVYDAEPRVALENAVHDITRRLEQLK